MSAARLGRRVPSEMRERIRASLLGHKVSAKTRARMSAGMLTHGDARHGATTRLYRCWTSMRNRCSNPKNRSWPNYGGKGIRVCEEWGTFPAFREWAVNMGWREGLSIERIDPDEGYGPANCEWVTVAENSRRSNITTPRATSGLRRAARVGTCSRWNVARGKACVCGAHV
jgi:hypothetical protein